MQKSKVEIVAHSRGPEGDELISVLCTFPRIILAEINTHRMLSKNTSSSRAIPFFSMVKSVTENTFIPYAFQKHHKGMQGKEYLDPDKKFTWGEISDSIYENFVKHFPNSDGPWDDIDIAFSEYVIPMFESGDVEGKTPTEWWLKTRDIVVGCAILLYSMGVTKQIANRLLEPFMWVTDIITGNKESWEAFFKLRAPMYSNKEVLEGEYFTEGIDSYYNSKNELIKDLELSGFNTTALRDVSYINWLLVNKGQSEIHMMELAENIYDSINDSEAKELKAGEWHIPFGKKILGSSYQLINLMNIADVIKISTSMSARTSYTVVGTEKKVDPEILLNIYESRLINQDPKHSSPFEHCSKVMNPMEYSSFIKGEGLSPYNEDWFDRESQGWCNNFRGFIQLRHYIDNNINPF